MTGVESEAHAAIGHLPETARHEGPADRGRGTPTGGHPMDGGTPLGNPAHPRSGDRVSPRSRVPRMAGGWRQKKNFPVAPH